MCAALAISEPGHVTCLVAADGCQMIQLEIKIISFAEKCGAIDLSKMDARRRMPDVNPPPSLPYPLPNPPYPLPSSKFTDPDQASTQYLAAVVSCWKGSLSSPRRLGWNGHQIRTAAGPVVGPRCRGPTAGDNGTKRRQYRTDSSLLFYFSSP